ncbi:MAG TPA: SCO family protein [Acidimicrobiales bacterium]
MTVPEFPNAFHWFADRPRSRWGRRHVVPRALLSAFVLLGLGLVGEAGGAGASTPSAPPASIGVTEHRTVPAAITDLAFQDQDGRTVTLDQFRGKVVLLAPFLTSCQEECPITTGALLEMAKSIARDGLAHQVALIEVTVDPGRDTPARLAAYARWTGSDWPLLTGTGATIAQLWRYFGVYYQTVPEGSPPGIDWETHQPYTYDVDHSDGFFLLDQRLRERFFAGGMVKVGKLPPRLQHLLDREGRSNLKDPGGGHWTVAQGLDAIGWVLGRQLPDRQ